MASVVSYFGNTNEVVLILEVKHRKRDEKHVAEQQEAVGLESIYPGKDEASYRQDQGENRCGRIAQHCHGPQYQLPERGSHVQQKYREQ